MNTRSVIITLMLLFSLPMDVFPVTVILKTGQAIDGAILEKTDTSIKMEFNGVPLTYELKDIESIDGEPVKLAPVAPQKFSASSQEARNARINKATEKYIEKALNKITRIQILEYSACKVLTNCDVKEYKEKIDLILLAINYVLPQLRGEFSFRAPEKKIRIIALDDRGYRTFLHESGNEYLKTPYGFTFKNVGTIVVNMDLGVEGFLRELVYVLIYDDIADAPVWIEEGLACLYEGSAWHDGKIYMKSSWRLPLFKQVIDRPKYIPLRELMQLEKITEDQEYATAQARYLMYYLYTKNILGKFYKEYKATRGEDYRGTVALERTVDTTIEQFEQEWLAWVRNLSMKKEADTEEVLEATRRQ
ncbi:MAG: hypothetical protein PHV55_02240 [Candidatus Omnitrophica bacterium]|nr:hypothetical protein [Candidatus Omnitrophota bacterium]